MISKPDISPPTLTKFGNLRGLVDAPIFLAEHWNLESVKALKRRSSTCPYSVASPGKSMHSNNNPRTSLKETLGDKKLSKKSEVITDMKCKTLSANAVHVLASMPRLRNGMYSY